MEAVTNVAAMTAAAREQLAGFLCRLASTHHSSLRVTTTAAWNIFNFALLSIVSTRASIGHLTANHLERGFYRFPAPEQTENGRDLVRGELSSGLDQERSRFHVR